MWLTFTIAHTFLLALVNYLDEYLTAHTKVPETSSIHTKIGGLIIVSTAFSYLGAIAMYFYLGDIYAPNIVIQLGLLSAVPMTIMFASYFYLLTLYPVHQVVPLFQLSTIWILLFEIFSGGSITIVALLGIFLLTSGAYLLDSGTFRWQIPTKLLLIMVPVALSSATALYLVRVASADVSANLVSFYQLVGIGTIGILAYVLIKPYRDGFLIRAREQGTMFIGFSIFNEGIAQLGYVFAMLAIAAVPIAAYFTSLSAGLQGFILLAMFAAFPIHERNKITLPQVLAIILIALGVFVIEGWK